MTEKVTLSEIEARTRHLRHYAQKGDAVVFESSVVVLRVLVDKFIEQERITLRHNSIPDEKPG